MHGAVQEEGHASTYGPWVMVAYRKSGTKIQRSGRAPPGQWNDRNVGFNGSIVMEATGMQDRDRARLSNGPTKENKRKLAPLWVLERAQVESSIQKIGKDALKRAQPSSPRIHEPNTLSIVVGQIDLSQNSLKHKSVKGKKILAHQRVSQSSFLSAVDSGVGKESCGEQLKGNTVECLKVERICDRESNIRVSSQFQFKVVACSELGHQFGGGNSSFGEDTGKSSSNYGVVQHGVKESKEIHFFINKEECEKGVDHFNKLACVGSKNRYGGSPP